MSGIITAVRARLLVLLLRLLDSIEPEKFSPGVRGVRNGSYRKSDHKKIRRRPYYAYTTQFDEEVSALSLCETAELEELAMRFQSQLSVLRENFRTEIEWAFDTLRRIEYSGRISVTLLVDNSGSMKGTKIAAVAAWTYILSDMLARVGIRNEVLGFMTSAWQGGKSRKLWIADRVPVQPGRLSDLRHIVYKDFGTPVQSASGSFSVMMCENILKENIDGEALLWAYRCAFRGGNNNAVILIFSDGAPVDDSTVAANSNTFLPKHLKATVKWLSEQLAWKYSASVSSLIPAPSIPTDSSLQRSKSLEKNYWTCCLGGSRHKFQSGLYVPSSNQRMVNRASSAWGSQGLWDICSIIFRLRSGARASVLVAASVRTCTLG